MDTSRCKRHVHVVQVKCSICETYTTSKSGFCTTNKKCANKARLEKQRAMYAAKRSRKLLLGDICAQTNKQIHKQWLVRATSAISEADVDTICTMIIELRALDKKLKCVYHTDMVKLLSGFEAAAVPQLMVLYKQRTNKIFPAVYRRVFD